MSQQNVTRTIRVKTRAPFHAPIHTPEVASTHITRTHAAPWAKPLINQHALRMTYFYANPPKRALEEAKAHVQSTFGCPVSLQPTVSENRIDHSVYEFSVFVPPNTPVELAGRIAQYMSGAITG